MIGSVMVVRGRGMTLSGVKGLADTTWSIYLLCRYKRDRYSTPTNNLPALLFSPSLPLILSNKGAAVAKWLARPPPTNVNRQTEIAPKVGLEEKKRMLVAPPPPSLYITPFPFRPSRTRANKMASLDSKNILNTVLIFSGKYSTNREQPIVHSRLLPTSLKTCSEYLLPGCSSAWLQTKLVRMEQRRNARAGETGYPREIRRVAVSKLRKHDQQGSSPTLVQERGSTCNYFTCVMTNVAELPSVSQRVSSNTKEVLTAMFLPDYGEAKCYGALIWGPYKLCGETMCTSSNQLLPRIELRFLLSSAETALPLRCRGLIAVTTTADETPSASPCCSVVGWMKHDPELDAPQYTMKTAGKLRFIDSKEKKTPKKTLLVGSYSLSSSMVSPPLETWAAMSERLDCSPPTKANRVQSPAGSLPLRIVPDDAAGRSLVFPTLAFRRLPTHRFTLTGSQGLDVKRRPNFFIPLEVGSKDECGVHDKMLWLVSKCVNSDCRGLARQDHLQRVWCAMRDVGAREVGSTADCMSSGRDNIGASCKYTLVWRFYYSDPWERHEVRHTWRLTPQSKRIQVKNVVLRLVASCDRWTDGRVTDMTDGCESIFNVFRGKIAALKAVHDKMGTFEINLRKKSLPLPAYVLTGALSDNRPLVAEAVFRLAQRALSRALTLAATSLRRQRERSPVVSIRWRERERARAQREHEDSLSLEFTDAQTGGNYATLLNREWFVALRWGGGREVQLNSAAGAPDREMFACLYTHLHASKIINDLSPLVTLIPETFPDFRMWEITMPLVVGFLGDLPYDAIGNKATDFVVQLGGCGSDAGRSNDSKLSEHWVPAIIYFVSSSMRKPWDATMCIVGSRLEQTFQQRRNRQLHASLLQTAIGEGTAHIVRLVDCNQLSRNPGCWATQLGVAGATSFISSALQDAPENKNPRWRGVIHLKTPGCLATPTRFELVLCSEMPRAESWPSLPLRPSPRGWRLGDKVSWTSGMIKEG
ncbi:hypothetical protein PR048_025772 [Dryococelus australis]|uniref:Uncharacterized protein n=1 Tax=Dryococelus australis TaxID=614101 RepID=A0ABQ9GJI0_9NEOP|nr:hypothetical protein PR048_025772 [Dryococelus australis]